MFQVGKGSLVDILTKRNLIVLKQYLTVPTLNFVKSYVVPKITGNAGYGHSILKLEPASSSNIIMGITQLDLPITFPLDMLL